MASEQEKPADELSWRDRSDVCAVELREVVWSIWVSYRSGTMATAPGIARHRATSSAIIVRLPATARDNRAIR